MSFLDQDQVIPRTFTVQAAYASEDVSTTFFVGMLNRMGMSRFKYGAVKDTKGKIDHIASLEARLERFKQDGNGEWLMDIANMAMIAFMTECHPAYHFRATDSDESPGRVGLNGAQGAGHNDSRLWKN